MALSFVGDYLTRENFGIIKPLQANFTLRTSPHERISTEMRCFSLTVHTICSGIGRDEEAVSFYHAVSHCFIVMVISFKVLPQNFVLPGADGGPSVF